VTPGLALALLGAAIGLAILYRGTEASIRRGCGSVHAEQLALLLDIGSWAAFAAGALLHSIPLGTLGIGLMVLPTFFPSVLIRLTGGADPICFFRAAIRELFDLLNERPFTHGLLGQAEAKRQALERFRSPRTAKALDAVKGVFDAQFPSEPDHEATRRAYDQLQSALAGLKSVHPW
jgi:hypothetical protein